MGRVMTAWIRYAFLLFGGVGVVLPAFAQTVEGEVRFDIVRFQVEGNTLLPKDEVERTVLPFAGRQRSYGDIQKALEALENSYRKRGFGTVQVYTPEQELTTGVVRLVVTEAVVGKVVITKNKYFDEDNIRASLPALKEGMAPNMRRISEGIQLANENPAKQVEVTLGVSDEEDKVDAKIEVTDNHPRRIYLTGDNTGTGATGKHRVGATFQHANLFNRDHVLTLTYITSPDKPTGVDVDIFSVGYRLPIFAWGDSIDIIYANSNTNTPATTAAISLTGKGEVLGLRYNHIRPRDGEYTSRVVFGFDQKYINSRCSVNGNPTTISPPGAVAGCTPFTLRPISVTYSGQWTRPGNMIDFNLGGAFHVFPLGSHYPYAFADGSTGTDRYSMLSGRRTSDHFSAFRFGASWTQVLPKEWLFRVAGSGQWSQTGLISAEQFGLAGSNAVRGFNERAVAADSGYLVNTELTTPNWLPGETEGRLTGALFYDFARGHNRVNTPNAAPATGPWNRVGIAAAGLGLRYSLNKDISAKADLARIMDAGPTNTESKGDWRLHFNLSVGF